MRRHRLALIFNPPSPSPARTPAFRPYSRPFFFHRRPLSASRRAAPKSALLLCAALAAPLLLAAGCGGLDSHVAVKTRPTTLGRVVVYRNGIAYFERRARAKDGRVHLVVPDDKVNDFLKSLTVTDARTGAPLPVSFPTQRRRGRGDVQMTIQLPDRAAREVVLTYISDAPAWKPTYRLMIGVDSKGHSAVKVQGWAVVDNTSGEDWKRVRVGVGSSSALSFRYDLRSVRRVYRQTIRHGQVVVRAPPSGGALRRTRQPRRVVMDLSDDALPRPVGHPARARERAPRPPKRVAVVATGAQGDRLLGSHNESTAGNKSPAKSRARREPTAEWRRYQAANQRFLRRQRQRALRQRQAEVRAKQLSARLRRQRGTIVIEGYARPGESRPTERSLDRANTLRNRLIRDGVAPARVKVVARGVVPGRRAGVRVVATPAPVAAKGAGAKQVSGADTPIGESHFESRTPITVAKGTSAMVSIVNQTAGGEVVYLYDPDGQRGDARYAFRAVRFRNPTTSTLEGGPVTVYGRKRFVGEGLTEAIPPGSYAIVPFAMDRQVRVERSVRHDDRIDRIVAVHRGALTAKMAHLRTTTLTLSNRSVKPATVYLRHRVGRGWKLVKTPKVVETVREARVIKVKLAPQTRRRVELVEQTPLRRVVDLRSQVGVELVTSWLKTPRATGAFTAQLRKLIAAHRQINHSRQTLANLRQRAHEFRVRMDELHVQIVSLDGMRQGGELLKHLRGKLREMSNRVQATTLRVVEEQEQLMLARIRYEDGVSELSMPDKGREGREGREEAGKPAQKRQAKVTRLGADS